jgi:restriction-modification enzyme MmeI-like protein
VQGSKPWDGGHLLFPSKADKLAFLKLEPGASKWIRPYVGTDELISGVSRYCLWLKSISPSDLTKLTQVRARLKLVAESRRKSPTIAVNELAAKPTLFAQDRQPTKGYLAVPEVSSETRRFIPIAFLSADVIASNKLLTGADADLFDFGLIISTMHMAWVRAVAGRLESRISYAPAVWNNFPRPTPDEKQKRAIESSAQGILDARSAFSNSSLGELYDPGTMPPELTKAHENHDRNVDAAYGKRRFASEVERLAFLFERYQTIAAPLALSPVTPRRRRSVKS